MPKASESEVALVLGGGGSKGALQVGLWRAMCELGIRPRFVVGASVGAVNGAYIAAGVGPRSLADSWSRLRRSDLFSFNWRLLWRAGQARSLLSARPLRNLLDRTLGARTFDGLDLPLHVVTTHLGAGEACVWSRGPLFPALQASVAIPGLLPPIHGDDGAWHLDGSLGDNVPIEVARRLGAGRVIAMNCRTCDRCETEDPGLTEVLGRAFGIAADCKLRSRSAAWADTPGVLLLQPDLGEHVQALDFSRGRELVEAGYEHALPRLRAWLEGEASGPEGSAAEPDGEELSGAGAPASPSAGPSRRGASV